MKQELLTPRQKTKPQLELTRTERFKNGATRNLIANDYIWIIFELLASNYFNAKMVMDRLIENSSQF